MGRERRQPSGVTPAPGVTGLPPPGPRVLLVTAQETLLDDVLRLAAAAGVEVEAIRDVGAARASWAGASLTLVGRDLARSVVDHRLPRRPDLMLLGHDSDDPDIFVQAVAVGAADVCLLPRDERVLSERIADFAERRGVQAPIVATVGGRGGAGSSTLAAALAIMATRSGAHALLVDGDPLGGGIDLLVGSEQASGLRWADLAASRGRLSGAALIENLPAADSLSVLARNRGSAEVVQPDAMRAVLSAARRSCDLVVIDLPRSVDEPTREALAMSSLVLVVVPAEVRATAAAAAVCTGVCAWATDVRVVVRGPSLSGLAADAIAEALGLPLQGYLAAEPWVAAAAERGEPPGRRSRGALARLCRAVLDEIMKG